MDMPPSDPGPHPVRSPERPRVGRDSGYTLIEMLVAIVLMGTIVLSIMGGMWAVVRASRQSDERAKVQAVLGSAADRVSVLDHRNCPEIDGVYEAFATKAATSVGWPESSVRISSYEYWDPDPTKKNWLGDCNASAGLTTEKTLQRITIEATSPSGNVTSSLQIIKSDIRPQEVKDVSAP